VFDVYLSTLNKSYLCEYNSFAHVVSNMISKLSPHLGDSSRRGGKKSFIKEINLIKMGINDKMLCLMKLIIKHGTLLLKCFFLTEDL
jgi:hypothetical protein